MDANLHVLLTEIVLNPRLGAHDVDTAFTILELFLESKCDGVLDVKIDGGWVDIKFDRPVTRKQATQTLESYHDPHLRVQVMNKKKNEEGSLITTSGGLTKDDLTRNKRNKIVSKRASETAKKCEPLQLQLWRNAVKHALYVEKLDDGRFHPIKKGTNLYNTVRDIYDESVRENKSQIKKRNAEIAAFRAKRAKSPGPKRERVSGKRPLRSTCKSPGKSPKSAKRYEAFKAGVLSPKAKLLSPKKGSPKKASPKKASPVKHKSPTPKKKSPSPRKKSPSPKKKSPSPKKKSPSPKKKSPTPKKAKSPTPKPRRSGRAKQAPKRYT
ncbi:hypothetical protein JKP88DRAFT_276175 [Tribonema minus]|uniref:Uncharacterized protein n=1 Tax=Tribonema minus TaxID=303371 RepID=A0A836CJE0_9STRA|nr:hypothetical protein JKP88DRAFT_276175 [Tribonema minus]